MFIVKLIRSFFGFVKFRIFGGFSERFLNLAIRNGINIWDIEKSNEAITGHTMAKDYKRLRPFVKKTGVKLKVLEKKGFRFQMKKYRKRIGICIGVGIFFVFLAIMSQFVWTIDIQGNERVETKEIEQALEKRGVKVGAWKKDLDIDKIENSMLIELDQLSWLAINLKGSQMVVNVKERIVAPEIVPEDVACNVIAGKTGQIMTLHIYEGQAAVRVGDTVMEGDIIASGIVVDRRDGNSQMKHARAKVIAKTEKQATIKIPLEYEKRELTGKTIEKNRLMLFGFGVPLFFSEKPDGTYESEQYMEQAQLFGIKLPFMLKVTKWSELSVEHVSLNEEQAKEEAMKRLDEIIAADLKDAEILEKRVDGQLTDTEYILNATLIAQEDIAVESEIYQ